MGRGSCFTSFYISFLFLKQMNKHLDIGVRGLGHYTHFPGLVAGKGVGITTSHWRCAGWGEPLSPDGLFSPFGQNSGLKPGPAPSPASPGLPGLGPAGGEPRDKLGLEPQPPTLACAATGPLTGGSTVAEWLCQVCGPLMSGPQAHEGIAGG